MTVPRAFLRYPVYSHVSRREVVERFLELTPEMIRAKTFPDPSEVPLDRVVAAIRERKGRDSKLNRIAPAGNAISISMGENNLAPDVIVDAEFWEWFEDRYDNHEVSWIGVSGYSSTHPDRALIYVRDVHLSPHDHPSINPQDLESKRWSGMNLRRLVYFWSTGMMYKGSIMHLDGNRRDFRQYNLWPAYSRRGEGMFPSVRYEISSNYFYIYSTNPRAGKRILFDSEEDAVRSVRTKTENFPDEAGFVRYARIDAAVEYFGSEDLFFRKYRAENRLAPFHRVSEHLTAEIEHRKDAGREGRRHEERIAAAKRHEKARKKHEEERAALKRRLYR